MAPPPASTVIWGVTRNDEVAVSTTVLSTPEPARTLVTVEVLVTTEGDPSLMTVDAVGIGIIVVMPGAMNVSLAAPEDGTGLGSKLKKFRVQ